MTNTSCRLGRRARLLALALGVGLLLAAGSAQAACPSLAALQDNLNRARAQLAQSQRERVDVAPQQQNVDVLVAGVAACERAGDGGAGYSGGGFGGGNRTQQALSAGASLLGQAASILAEQEAEQQAAADAEAAQQAQAQAEQEAEAAAQRAMAQVRDNQQRAAMGNPFGGGASTADDDNPFASPSAGRPTQVASADGSNPFAAASAERNPSAGPDMTAYNRLGQAGDAYQAAVRQYGSMSPQADAAKRAYDQAAGALPKGPTDEQTQASVNRTIANLNAMYRNGPATPSTGASSAAASAGCVFMASNLKAAMDAVNATKDQAGHDSQVENLIAVARGFSQCAKAGGQGVGQGTELLDAVRLAEAARQMLASPDQAGGGADLPDPATARPTQVAAKPSGPPPSNCDNQPEEQLSPTGAYKSIGCIPSNVAGRPYMGPKPGSDNQDDEPVKPGEMTTSAPAPAVAQASVPPAPPAPAVQPAPTPPGNPSEADGRPLMDAKQCGEQHGDQIPLSGNAYCVVGSTWYHLAS